MTRPARRLLFTLQTLGKIAGHGITAEEVRQVNDSDRIVLRNPRPRVVGLSPDERANAWRSRAHRRGPRGVAQVQRYHHDRYQGNIETVNHDEEITSGEFDGLLNEAETLRADHPSGATEMRLYVSIDAGTLHELEQRAARAGTDVTDAASDALRAGTRAT